jgi:hypothetical protein
MLPPADTPTGPRELALADLGMALADQMEAEVPEGRHLDAAHRHLSRALQAAYAGMQPALLLDGTADESIPCTVTTAADLVPEIVPGEYPDPDLWTLGITTSGLHPLTRLVALTLARCALPSGYIPADRQPTLALLLARTGLPNLQVVHVHLNELVARGWATRRRQQAGQVTQYQLRLPAPHGKGAER